MPFRSTKTLLKTTLYNKITQPVEDSLTNVLPSVNDKTLNNNMFVT